MFKLIKQLKQAGVLGINQRNCDFTLVHNQRKYYPLVDDKLQTKQLAQKVHIAIPELYAVIEFERQLSDLSEVLAHHSDFVLKPAHGSGGNGIIVIVGKHKDMYRKSNGTLVDVAELRHHISNILSGIYSLGGQPDKALIEYRVKFDPVFEHISFQGIPDLRIVVFLGVPVMAMVRLPTRSSDGRANLHQGAIGAGIDIATGRTLTAVMNNKIILEHPDTGNDVTNVQVPNWDTLLRLASSCYELTGLGYLGVDIVLDRDLGPLILELNARPGLNIQIANNAGLLHRLNLIKQTQEQLTNIEERVGFAKQHFSVLH
jgi:alpha-L-glutamate ligase-like protein